MKEIQVAKIGPDEERLIEILGRVWQKSTAKMIVYLLLVPEATPAEVEIHMDMRQPEVSNATRVLLKENLISIKQKRLTLKKGRPGYIIKITKSKKELAKLVEAKMLKEIEQIEKDIISLKKLINEARYNT